MPESGVNFCSLVVEPFMLKPACNNSFAKGIPNQPQPKRLIIEFLKMTPIF